MRKNNTQPMPAEPDVSHKDLWYEIQLIKDNHLKHLSDDVDELKDAVKENREFFQSRLDRLDNRIWWIMGLSFTTMLGIIAQVLLNG